MKTVMLCAHVIARAAEGGAAAEIVFGATYARAVQALAKRAVMDHAQWLKLELRDGHVIAAQPDAPVLHRS
ncbi:hypothetical protein [Paraburkholderia sp. BR10882]|uniref:hypothetical protein n=1 Tax=unclassified Paraburkholderia TaxID=2615204 RepID=UPI0034CFC81D